MESLVFEYSHFYCDVERMLDDPLEQRGLGICYDLTNFDEEININSFSKEKPYNFYIDHHATLAKMLSKYDTPLLIDCHSFSSSPTLLCPNPPEDIDIYIGYKDDKTRPSDFILNKMESYFTRLGYRVGRNKPFSNSKTAPTPSDYHSVMIEVNKRLYLNEESYEKLSDFEKLHQIMCDLYDELMH